MEHVAWEQNDYSRIPYRLFHDPLVYALEQQRIFRGAVWNYLCLEAEIPKPGDFRTTWLGETPVLIARVSETGEEGFRLIFVVEYAQNIWDALTAVKKVVPWKPVGHAAWNILRTEAGVPWYGVDMDERTLPPEAALEARALSYSKGCYVGQEIIERIRSRGHVNRRLAGFHVSGPLPAAGAKLLRGGQEVGVLTTAVESPTLGRAIALGYLRREHLAAGTTLEVEGAGGAEVVELPFYRRAS